MANQNEVIEILDKNVEVVDRKMNWPNDNDLLSVRE